MTRQRVVRVRMSLFIDIDIVWEELELIWSK
jgi:hypothetical protein